MPKRDMICLYILALIGLLAIVGDCIWNETHKPKTIPSTVTVKEGDTLWSIAKETNPHRDPREVCYELEEKNKIKDALIRPGQVLQVRKEVSRGRQTLYMVATAYTWTGHRTSSGKWPKVGMIAVDPNVIPIGTRVYVEGYGEAVAEDTGGDIKGYWVDVYKDTEQEADNWGRRKNVKVIVY